MELFVTFRSKYGHRANEPETKISSICPLPFDSPNFVQALDASYSINCSADVTSLFSNSSAAYKWFAWGTFIWCPWSSSRTLRPSTSWAPTSLSSR